MHGFNVTPEYAEATFAEVFKRFFHAGYSGRFIGVEWYGDPPAPMTWLNDDFPTHFHQSVVNAFANAKAYAAFINTMSNPGLPGDEDRISIAAHSLGNLVVGEAIQEYNLRFGRYFAIDAAAESVGSNLYP